MPSCSGVVVVNFAGIRKSDISWQFPFFAFCPATRILSDEMSSFVAKLGHFIINYFFYMLQNTRTKQRKSENEEKKVF